MPLPSALKTSLALAGLLAAGSATAVAGSLTFTLTTPKQQSLMVAWFKDCSDGSKVGFEGTSKALDAFGQKTSVSTWITRNDSGDDHATWVTLGAQDAKYTCTVTGWNALFTVKLVLQSLAMNGRAGDNQMLLTVSGKLGDKAPKLALTPVKGKAFVTLSSDGTTVQVN